MKSGQVPGATARHRCPHCKKRLDGYSTAEAGAVPEPGSLSICAYCGTFGVFVEGGIERLLAKDFDALPADVRGELERARAAVARVRQPGFPPAYYRDASAMQTAAEAWIESHPCVQATFRELPKNVALIGSLDAYGINLLACNEHAAELLRAMDKASSHRGTILQARAVLEVVFAPAGGAEG